MASIIRFQSLTGAEGDVPHCYLLEIDETTLLLDAGWDVNCTEALMTEVKRRVNDIDAVLLSFPDLAHAGALPYLFGKCGLSCPVYATVPVYKMGQMFLYDQRQSRYNSEEFGVYTLDDVDAAFDRVVQLKYNQSVVVGGSGEPGAKGGGGGGGGCTVTPLPAGHMIGGTVWRISRPDDDDFVISSHHPHNQQQQQQQQHQQQEDIIYGIDLNHKKERHLNGCQLESVYAQRPAVFITDAYNLLRRPTRRRQRDEQLVTAILQTVRGGGNVLVAVDTAGRVLELVLMLEQLWHSRDSGLQTYRLLLLNNVCYNVVEFAKSQIEWMSERLARGFESARANPFQLRHVQLCHSLDEVMAVSGPRVVLATCASLECGFARDLFAEWCANAANHIVLTMPPTPGTLAHELVARCCGAGGAGGGATKSVSLLVKRRVRLEGVELAEFRRREAMAARARAAALAGHDADSSDDSDHNGNQMDDDDERAGGLVPAVIDLDGMSDDETARPATTGADGVAAPAAGGGGTADGHHDLFLAGGRHNPLFYRHTGRRRHPMFPHREKRVRHDDYGQPVSPGRFSLLADQSPDNAGGGRSASSGLAAFSAGEGASQMDSDAPMNAAAGAANGGGGGEDGSVGAAGGADSGAASVPSKCLSYYRTFTVAAGVSLIDFDGRTDGDSMLSILEKMRPRHLILTRAPEKALKSLTIKLAQVADRVLLAPPGQTVDATATTHIYRLRLRHALVAQLQFSRTRHAELAWLDGVVAAAPTTATAAAALPDEDEQRDVVAMETDQQQQQQLLAVMATGVPYLEPLPDNEPAPPHPAVFVNDLKLSDFKQILVRNGVQSEFSGGVLWCCEGTVALRRQEQTNLVTVEGCLSDDYFRVRGLLYEQYAVV